MAPNLKLTLGHSLSYSAYAFDYSHQRHRRLPNPMAVAATLATFAIAAARSSFDLLEPQMKTDTATLLPSGENRIPTSFVADTTPRHVRPDVSIGRRQYKLSKHVVLHQIWQPDRSLIRHEAADLDRELL